MSPRRRSILRASTPVELLAKVYRAEGWTRKPGESRAARVQRLYTIHIKGSRYVAVPREQETLPVSTDLKPLNDNTTVTRFWGGARGVCLQLSQRGQQTDRFNPVGVGYVQLTREDARKLGEQLLAFADDPLSPSLEDN